MNNSVFLLGIILTCLFLLVVSGQKIIRLETKTADIGEAGMGIGGSIAVELLMRDATYCRIGELSSDGFNFQQGKIDVFVGEDLGACANFTAPGGEIARLTLSHRQ